MIRQGAKLARREPPAETSPVARAKPAWTFPVAAFLGAALLRVWHASWRIDEAPRRFIDARRSARGDAARTGTVYLLWHSRILLGAATQKGLGLRVLISLHGDGEYIARTVERLGFRAVRGSSTRGGSRALRELIGELRAGNDVAVTPDGPKGPRFRVQRGAIEAASVTGAPIVPVGLDCRSRKRLRSWDRFLIPWFFTRTVVRFGDEIRVPPDLDDAGLESWRVRVEEALIATQRSASEAAGVAAESPDTDPCPELARRTDSSAGGARPGTISP